MKNGKAILLNIAVILGAAGMIFGNHVFAPGALAASNMRESAIVMLWGAPASTVQWSDTGMYRNARGELYIAPVNRSADVRRQEDAPLSDEAPQSSDAEGEKNTMVALESMEDLPKEETPLDHEITCDQAREIGIAALVEKYAITQETLGKFTVTMKYYEVTDEEPGKHVWWVSLYPAITDDYSEIGCYWTFLDAETGDILQLNSAADGKG